MAPPFTLSKQGFELQFAVNHLAQIALTLELIPLLSKQIGFRVVTVSSGIQYFGNINWEDLQGENNYDRWASYSQSKLANVMFALELDRILLKTGSCNSSLVAHSGLARTNLHKTSVSINGSWQENFAYTLIHPIFQNASMGALPQLLFAATAPKAIRGKQYGPRFNFGGYLKLCRISSLALDELNRKRLWKISEELIGDFNDLSFSAFLK